MGSGCDVLEAAVEHLVKQGEKVGVLKVRLPGGGCGAGVKHQARTGGWWVAYHRPTGHACCYSSAPLPALPASGCINHPVHHTYRCTSSAPGPLSTSWRRCPAP